jgi:APA family basic amino acid/polyamine antiporter
MGLYREIGLASATFLVVGNIVGIGIFTTSGLIADGLGATPWLIGVWLVGGILALIGASCYASLGTMFPRAGGEYAFLKPAFGPLPSFLSGWSSLLIGFTAPIAASALGLSHYLYPILFSDQSEDPLKLRLSAITALLVVAAFISVGLKAGNNLHAAITVLNLVLIVSFAVTVLLSSDSSGHLASSVLTRRLDIAIGPLASAVILVMFTYSGWNAAAYIAEEIRSPGRNIPGALLLGTVTVVVIYLLINLAYYSGAPLSAIGGQVAVAEVVASHTLGEFGRSFTTLLIVFSILSSLTAMSIAGPRVYFAMARDHVFPGWLSSVHPIKKIPLRAIWFQTLIAVFFISVGSFYEILLYSGFVLIFFSTLTVAGLFRMSRRRLLPSIFVVGNLMILVSAISSHPHEAFWGLLTVSLGIPVYYYFRSAARRSV